MKKLMTGLLAFIVLYVQPSLACADFITGVFIGDSNTSTDTRTSQGLGYVNWLNVATGFHYRFFNGGCYGATTRDWWLPASTHPPVSFCYGDSYNSPRLFDIRALPYLPSSFAVIMLGSNDAVGALEDNPTSVAEYGNNLEAMALEVIHLGTPLVILMTPPTRLDCVLWALQGQQVGIDCINRLLGYKDEVVRICNEHSGEGIVCGPDVQALTIASPQVYFNPQPWNDNDATHITSAGHIIIANALKDVLIAHGLFPPPQ
jgi:lysophospholipase L1-like esterase